MKENPARRIKKVAPEQDETQPFSREQYDALIQATWLYDSRDGKRWISAYISEYWEHLFDAETGHPKEEIQNEFEVVDLDLLIIDYVAIYPEFRE